ncbi:MAG TPA: hypothetical protein VIT64_17475 [Ilumatobacteraceae bacterium]
MSTRTIAALTAVIVSNRATNWYTRVLTSEPARPAWTETAHTIA